MAREFCRIHAFYDCPICKGEEVTWVIPIVDGKGTDGRDIVVGVIEIPEEFEADEGYFLYEGPGEQLPPIPLPQRVVQDPDPDAAALMATVKEIFSWENTPRGREAAARGRAVHEEALRRSETGDISYQEHIEDILREQAEGERDGAD